jgi:hypothetical protein
MRVHPSVLALSIFAIAFTAVVLAADPCPTDPRQVAVKGACDPSTTWTCGDLDQTWCNFSRPREPKLDAAICAEPLGPPYPGSMCILLFDHNYNPVSEWCYILKFCEWKLVGEEMKCELVSFYEVTHTKRTNKDCDPQNPPGEG